MAIRSRPLLLAAAATLLAGVGGCDWLKPKPNTLEQKQEAREKAVARNLKAACSSRATYDRLKQVAFDEAIRIRNADPVNLDILATHAVVRMEQPTVKSRDEELDVTVCTGRFILELPPGAERGFGGERRLVADIEYAAQAAADGSGLVYQIKGAEPIIYKLAAFDLKNQRYPAPPRGTETQVAVRETQAAADNRPSLPDAAPPPPAPAPPPPPAPSPRETPETRRQVVASPSFDCRLARTRSERMVCGSPQLAALDRAMSSRFYSALSRGDAGTRAELRRSRDRFLAYRERCSDEACVAEAYRDRMDEIRDIAAGG